MPTATNIQAAVQNWFRSRSDLAALFADGRLHHLEAPEDTPLPYLTFFAVAEPETERTTGYYFIGSEVQFSAHAATDAEAADLRDAVRNAIDHETIVIDGKTAWYALPGAQQLLIGEGRGPNGSDCWMGTVDVSMPWQRGG